MFLFLPRYKKLFMRIPLYFFSFELWIRCFPDFFFVEDFYFFYISPVLSLFLYVLQL